MMTLSMLPERWTRAKRSSSAAVLLFGFVACGAPANNAALFGGGGSITMSAGTSGALEVAGGGSGGPGTSGASSGGSLGDASGAGLGGGAAGMSDAGSAGATLAGSGGSNLSGGTGGGAPLSDCAAFGTDATYYSETQHCYLVVHDLATFADAKTHCSSLGAHLVTLSNQDENDFVWTLDTNEHWIGTTDGKGPKETTAGTYSWVDGEPFTYADWSSGQPNASKTSCGDSNGGGDCYEHCGFQWSGGDKAGEWNDRYCLQTIEAICEWD